MIKETLKGKLKQMLKQVKQHDSKAQKTSKKVQFETENSGKESDDSDADDQVI